MSQRIPEYEICAVAVSPRGIIDRALLAADFERDADLWSCLTCDQCTALCPEGVRVRDFVVAARALVVAAGHVEHAAYCGCCGAHVGPQHTADYLERTLSGEEAERLALCAACRRREQAAKARGLVPGRPGPGSTPETAPCA